MGEALRRLAGLFLRVTPFRLSLVLCLVFTALFCSYEWNPTGSKLLETLADKSLDLKFALRGARWPLSKIIILTGDELAFQTYGERPWDRGAVFAPAIERLCQLGAKVIGFDVLFTDHERLVAPRVKDRFSTLLASSPGALDSTLSEFSGDALIRKAIEACRGKVVLAYDLRPRSDGVPVDQFKEREAILVDRSPAMWSCPGSPPPYSFHAGKTILTPGHRSAGRTAPRF